MGFLGRGPLGYLGEESASPHLCPSAQALCHAQSHSCSFRGPLPAPGQLQGHEQLIALPKEGAWAEWVDGVRSR